MDDLRGVGIGRWTVVINHPLKLGRNYVYLCRCECGTVRMVHKSILQKRKSQSCGCLRAEMSSSWNKTHGACGTPEYVAWKSMNSRCNSPGNKDYKNYGGRGIAVCDRWRDDFNVFVSDMGQRPSNAHSIDRIDNSKGYGPDNCRWVANVQQNNNRRCNRLVEWNGRTATIAQLADEHGMRYSLVYGRLKAGWTIAQALSKPSNRKVG